MAALIAAGRLLYAALVLPNHPEDRFSLTALFKNVPMQKSARWRLVCEAVFVAACGLWFYLRALR